MNETRVYVWFPADSELTQDSPNESVITHCEITGNVYTLPGFQEAINNGDLETMGAYIRFIGEQFPNSFASWHETHYEAVCHIMQACELKGTAEWIAQQLQGTGGLYELAEAYTNEFEIKNKGREWDGEFFDEVSDFLEAKSKAPQLEQFFEGFDMFKPSDLTGDYWRHDNEKEVNFYLVSKKANMTIAFCTDGFFYTEAMKNSQKGSLQECVDFLTKETGEQQL